MCDLIPSEVWHDIRSTFLEPACGNGNFLVEIYARKLALCKTEKDGLAALASLRGIDILADNCEESRARLLQMFVDKFTEASEFAILTAALILRNNIICGDALVVMREWEVQT